MKKLLSIIGLFTMLGLAYYFESDEGNRMDEFRFSIRLTPEDIIVETFKAKEAAQTNSDPTDSIIPTFEYILERQDEEDGYIIETYREYEIYRDQNGQIIKRVPTTNFDFLRYKKY